MNKAHVTFSCISGIACIRVRGEKRDFPECPADNGLVLQLMQWLFKNEIYEVVPGGTKGPGMYLGFFTEEDAAKICAWLAENDAIKDEEKTWERRS